MRKRAVERRARRNFRVRNPFSGPVDGRNFIPPDLNDLHTPKLADTREIEYVVKNLAWLQARRERYSRSASRPPEKYPDKRERRKDKNMHCGTLSKKGSMHSICLSKSILLLAASTFLAMVLMMTKIALRKSHSNIMQFSFGF